MKYLTLVFTLFSQVTFAQYYPVPGVGANWTCAHYGMEGISPPFSYSVTGDSIINGHLYSIIGDGLYRSSLNRWFCIKQGETQEHLLFDFNLEVGDTLFFNNPLIPSYNQADFLLVMTVDSVQLLNGNWVRDMTLGVPNNINYFTQDYRWIESVGCASYLFNFGTEYEVFDVGDDFLICFTNEFGEHIYESPLDSQLGWMVADDIIYENCNWYVGIEEIDHSQNLRVFPNPAKDVLLIENLGDEIIEKIHLMDMKGVTIMNYSVNSRTLNVSNIPNGKYILYIKTQNSTIVESINVIR